MTPLSPHPQRPMDFDQYQQECLVTWRTGMDDRDRLANAAIGLADEVGEILGPIKKHLYHDQPLDRAAATRELGDGLYYLAMLAHELGIGLEDVARTNIAKLRARHRGGPFDPGYHAREAQPAGEDRPRVVHSWQRVEDLKADVLISMVRARDGHVLERRHMVRTPAGHTRREVRLGAIATAARELLEKLAEYEAGLVEPRDGEG